MITSLLVIEEFCTTRIIVDILTRILVNISMRHKSHLLDAIEFFGSQQKLAEAIGYSQQGISFAMHAPQISARMAAAIHKATEGKISRAEMRPDIFGED